MIWIGTEWLAILAASMLAIGCAQIASSADETWRKHAFGKLLTFSAPSGVAPTGEQGIDSAFGSWEGKTLRISMDHGLFGDRLNSYEGRPGYDERKMTIGGEPARVVEFDELDDTHFVGAHFAGVGSPPRPLTVVVVSKEGADPEIAHKVLRSIVFQ